jgi:methionine-rich copper-binding protein CopC
MVHSENQDLEAGLHTLEWNLQSDHAVSGTYFYRVQNGDRTATGKLISVR